MKRQLAAGRAEQVLVRVDVHPNADPPCEHVRAFFPRALHAAARFRQRFQSLTRDGLATNLTPALFHR